MASTGAKVGKATVINYLGYASDAYLLLTVPNIADSLTDRITNPKYYFIDNGIISLLAMDIRTSLLENLVALTLFRSYGIKDAVYYYNHGIEVDFVIPDEETAIQVCYSMNNSDGTFDREVSALVKLQDRIRMKRNIIVTYEDEGVIKTNGINIEVIPIWKYILKKC